MSAPAPTDTCVHAFLARTAAPCAVKSVWLCVPEAAPVSCAVPEAAPVSCAVDPLAASDLGCMVNRLHGELMQRTVQVFEAHSVHDSLCYIQHP